MHEGYIEDYFPQKISTKYINAYYRNHLATDEYQQVFMHCENTRVFAHMHRVKIFNIFKTFGLLIIKMHLLI
jgi:hypothetical protein